MTVRRQLTVYGLLDVPEVVLATSSGGCRIIVVFV